MLLSAAAAGFMTGGSLIIAIGAQNAFVLRHGLRRRHVGLIVMTTALGDIALILGGVAGIGALVEAWPALIDGLRIAGVVFLVGYGLAAARRAWHGTGGLSEGRSAGGGRRRALLACLGFTFLNPHVYLDTMVLVGGLSLRFPGVAQWAFAFGACLASATWFTALGYGSRVLQPVFAWPRAWRILDAGIAALMFALSILLLRGG